MDAGPASVLFVMGVGVAIAVGAVVVTWLGGVLCRRREHRHCERLHEQYRARMAMRAAAWQGYLAAERAAIACLQQQTVPLPAVTGRRVRVVGAGCPDPSALTTIHQAVAS